MPQQQSRAEDPLQVPMDEDTGKGAEPDRAEPGEQPPQALEIIAIRIVLPSGTSLPLRASKAALVRDIKEALRQQCGWPPGSCCTFGLALGRSALREDASLGSNDVTSGDAVVVYQRTAE